MKIANHFDEYPYLKRSFLFYILLGTTDIVHHLHAAMVLGHSNAIHAVWTGVILGPIAILLILRYRYSKNKKLLCLFFAIAGLAILIPGFYHGGWHHLMKILAFAKIHGQSTSIKLLFPADNFNLWFYEITGLLEFVFAALSVFFLYKNRVSEQ